MRIALAQLNYTIGNFELNFEKIAAAIEKAKSEKADLVVFSELSVCGYPPHDLLEHKAFIDKCYFWVEKIAEITAEIAVIVGAPTLNTNPKGKTLYNSAYFIENKKITKVYHKALLPTYDIFDEYRYFEPGNCFETIDYKGLKIALTICEDLWDNPPVENPFGKTRLYNVSPMKELAKLQPDIAINISASPFDYNKTAIKEEIFTSHAVKHNVPLLYVNQVGAHTDLIFDGGSLIIDNKGTICDALAIFNEDFKIIDTDNIQKNTNELSIHQSRIGKIHDALVLGIRDYFNKTGLKQATLGLSGGIDSAVTLVLAARALGKDNLRVLLMPSKYSSDHSVNDAVKLAQNLPVKYDILNIQNGVDSVETTLKPLFEGLQTDITEENIQARMRGILLMALSNKFGHILLNTSNKSEIAVGYGTLYGDMNGGLSVLGDVYKTDVFLLAKYINRDNEIIPVNIITKPPSAELRPNQKDSDSLPEYDILDAVLYKYIEQQKSAEEIINEGFDAALVKRVIKLVNFNEYKRFQTPPILRISSKAFGMGRKMPIVARY